MNSIAWEIIAKNCQFLFSMHTTKKGSPHDLRTAFYHINGGDATLWKGLL